MNLKLRHLSNIILLKIYSLFKQRPLRFLSFAVALFFPFLLFQNCAKPATCNSTTSISSGNTTSNSSTSNSTPTTTSSTDCSTSASSSNQNPTSTTPKPSTNFSSNGNVTVGQGSSTGGSNSSPSNGNITVGGGGTSGSGSGGNSSGSATSVQNLNATLTGDVQFEGTYIRLNLAITGGIQPITYTWKQNGNSIFNSDHTAPTTVYVRNNQADPYGAEGLYTVAIREGNGKITNKTYDFRLGCQKGDYYIGADYSRLAQLASLFNPFNNSHGKFGVRSSNQLISSITSNLSYLGAVSFNFASDVSYDVSVGLTCRDYVPGIHTPQMNPMMTETWNFCGNNYKTCANYQDNPYWVYQGDITFKCQNNKFRFVSSNCQWVRTSVPIPESAPTPDGSTGG